MASEPNPSERLLFALLAVELDCSSPVDVAESLAECPAEGGYAPLAEALARRGLTAERRRDIEQSLSRIAANQMATLAEPIAAQRKDERQRSAQAAAEARQAVREDELNLPGERAGRYLVKGVHGRGGQAKVLLAFDEEMDREVALKVMRNPGTSSSMPPYSSMRSTPGALRFLREAKVTASLEHPNIVPVHELGRREDGSLYYTMRLVRGRTLAKSLEECKTLAERLKRIGSFWDVCNAVAFAHSKGVIHRDLKPENIMVGEFGETVLLDWGVAKVHGERDIGASDLKREIDRLHQDSDRTQAGTAVGTPSYMSPEQAMGLVDEIDGRSDVWGLGAVLYEILTGRPPFKGQTPVQTLDAVVNKPHLPVRTAVPEAPRELTAIAEKCLQKEKADRYQSAHELATEIEAFMTGGRVHAYHYSSLELVRRFYAQNRAAVVAAGLLLAVIVAALISVSVALKSETQARAREYQERLTANFHLAQAFAEKADRMSEDQRFLSTALFASASLLHNPAHPLSPFFDPGFAAQVPASEQSRVGAASQTYRAGFGTYATLSRSLSTGDVADQVAFSRDGTLLVAASGQRVVRFRLPGGEPLPPLSGGHQEYIYGVAISPDASLIASCDRAGQVVVWDAAAAKPRFQLKAHEGAAHNVAFTPDGTRLVSSGYDGTLKVIDLADGKIAASLATPAQHLNSLALSADGKLAAVSADDHLARIIDLATGKPLPQVFAHDSIALAASFSPDGTLLATGSEDRRVRIWEAATGKLLHTLEGHRDGVPGLDWSPDGKLLGTVGWDKSTRLWDVAEGLPLITLGSHDDLSYGIAFAPDGRSFATTGYDKVVKLWQLRQAPGLTTLRGHSGVIYGLAFSRDGSRLASGSWDKKVIVWDLKSHKPLATLSGHTEAIDGGVALDAEARRAVSGGRDGTVRIWDVASGKPLHVLQSSKSIVYGISMSPDGRLAASSGQDARVHLWDVESGAELRTLTGHEAVADRTAFSPDGSLLATAGYDKTVRLWEVKTGKMLKVLSGHQDWVSGAVFSADGKRLASSGKDGVAIVWDVESGQQTLRLLGHTQWVNDVRFSPDGKLLATGSDDTTVRVWSAQTGKTLMVINCRSQAVALEFTPDGKSLAVGDDNEIKIYPLDFSALESEPQGLLETAQRQAGYRLEGFELKAIAPEAAAPSP